jgi:type I restriction enzyme, R subunit
LSPCRPPCLKVRQQGVYKSRGTSEKAVFDILTKPEPDLTQKDREQVKAVARTLLQSLKDGKLVLDWTKKEQARGAVRQTIEMTLDDGLPDAYNEAAFNRKCDTLYQHIFDAYRSGGSSIYGTV